MSDPTPLTEQEIAGLLAAASEAHLCGTPLAADMAITVMRMIGEHDRRMGELAIIDWEERCAEVEAERDDLRAQLARLQAQGGEVPSPTGTSSAGAVGTTPPDAPSDQPAPQVGDVWESEHLGRYRLTRIDLDGWYPHHVESVAAIHSGEGHDQRIVDLHNTDDRFTRWRLVERDGRPWPPAQEPVCCCSAPHVPCEVHEPAQEPEPGEDCGQNVEAERPEPDPHDYGANCWWPEGQTKEPAVPFQPTFSRAQGLTSAGDGVGPATDEEIERWMSTMSEHRLDSVHRALIARVRQEQGQATEFLNGRTRWQERAQIAEGQVQRLIGERDEAVARAELAEAERDEAREALDVAQGEIRLLRAEAERMRPVVGAACEFADVHPIDERESRACGLICPAVRAYRSGGEALAGGDARPRAETAGALPPAPAVHHLERIPASEVELQRDALLATVHLLRDLAATTATTAQAITEVLDSTLDAIEEPT